MSAEFLVVTTTLGDADEAKSLAQVLVEARLVACVQIIPIESVYRWNEAVETASEYLLTCKIRAADYKAVKTEIHAKHSYEVPEIVAVPIAAGSVSYLHWLAGATAR